MADAAVSTLKISCVPLTETIVKLGPPIATPLRDGFVKIKLPPTVTGTTATLDGLK